MSMSTNPGVPLFPAFNPYSLDPSQILASMQNTNLTANVYEGTSKTIGAINDTQRLMTTEFSNVNKNIYDTIAENAVAIERNGAQGTATTERVGFQVNSAVDRNGNQLGVAVERNGGNILSTIEKVAGEGRLTTTIVDAASRQAANDSARDVLRAVDRAGLDAVSTTKETYAGILQSVERNAGETRLANAIGQGQTDVKLTDVRHSVLSDVNRIGSEIISAGTQNFNVLNKAVSDGAWEQRTASATGFQNLAEEHLRTKFDIVGAASAHHTSNILENQKIKEQLAMQGANNYASMLLEAQKNKSDLASHSAMQFAAMVSKSDGHYASLGKQMDCHYASIILEQQKSKELISRELAEAKYEALKNKMELSKEMGDCCCEIKQKVDQRTQEVIGVVDTLDRNRLRDEVNTTTNENNLLKFAELGALGGPIGYGGYGGYGRGSRGRHGGHGRR
jgi:hypothetical protein